MILRLRVVLGDGFETSGTADLRVQGVLGPCFETSVGTGRWYLRLRRVLGDDFGALEGTWR